MKRKIAFLVKTQQTELTDQVKFLQVRLNWQFKVESLERNEQCRN